MYSGYDTYVPPQDRNLVKTRESSVRQEVVRVFLCVYVCLRVCLGKKSPV